jgi:hypothetical protein
MLACSIRKTSTLTANYIRVTTFTTSAAGNYYGSAIIDINSTGTPIVVKTTFSGTSFTGKASATIERIQ